MLKSLDHVVRMEGRPRLPALRAEHPSLQIMGFVFRTKADLLIQVRRALNQILRDTHITVIELAPPASDVIQQDEIFCWVRIVLLV